MSYLMHCLSFLVKYCVFECLYSMPFFFVSKDDGHFVNKSDMTVVSVAICASVVSSWLPFYAILLSHCNSSKPSAQQSQIEFSAHNTILKYCPSIFVCWLHFVMSSLPSSSLLLLPSSSSSPPWTIGQISWPSYTQAALHMANENSSVRIYRLLHTNSIQTNNK